VERQKIPTTFVQSTVTSPIDLRLQTITQQILSRAQLEGLINRFNLYPDMRQQLPLEAVMARMRQDIELNYKRLQEKRNSITTAFTISYSGSEPDVVAQVTNTLASLYIEENLKVREQLAAGTAEFLRVQLVQVKDELEKQEQRLSQFKEQHIGELPEQSQANLAALERLNTQLRMIGDKQARLGEQRVAVMQQLSELEGNGSRIGSTAGSPHETNAMRLERLQQELRVLRTRYGEKYPDIVQRQAEITLLEQLLTEKAKTMDADTSETLPLHPYERQLRQQLSTINTESKALEAQEDSLLLSIASYQQRVENTPRREQELSMLLRDYQTTKNLYELLLKRQEEAKLAENLEQRQQGEQFRLLEPATPSAQPWAPQRPKLLLIGLIVALGLAVGAVFVAEQLDSSFHTVDALRAYSQFPALVSVPYIVTVADIRRKRWTFGLATASTAVGLVLIVGASFVGIKGWEELVDLFAQLQRTWQ
jgi:polysaccharide chain length determinant protein (PEP-CTERM system associated)